MTRVFAAFAALCALAACGVIGPSQADVEAGLRAYYANGTPQGSADLGDASVADFDGCRPQNGFYQCPVVFQTADGRVSTIVSFERGPHGWTVQHVALNARPPR